MITAWTTDYGRTTYEQWTNDGPMLISIVHPALKVGQQKLKIKTMMKNISTSMMQLKMSRDKTCRSR